ncbi:MAG: ShlB/FhaC/HecB family hemolysin secretion/activation protein [Alphaproteobacteria bacterium]
MKNYKYYTQASISAFALLCTLNAPAMAQVDQATGIADPSRIEEQFRTDAPLPTLEEDIAVESRAPTNAPAGAENITFVLDTLEIEGVSAYNAAELAPVYNDFLGATVSLADIYVIANDLTNKYRNDGFILSQIVVPPQTIEGGVVRLRVVEGFVDQVIIDGEGSESEQGVIRDLAANIRKNDAVNIADLEKFLLLINDLPGVNARTVLSPSRTQVGASDLRIIIARTAFDGMIGFDNFGSRYLGPAQFTASGALNSFFGNNEKITGQFVTATDVNEPELFYGSVRYEQPINGLGTIAQAFVSHSDTEAGFDLEQFNVHGRSTHAGIGVEHPFVRSRTRNFKMRAQLDWRKVESSNDVSLTRKDDLRVFRVGGTYDVLDTIFGAAAVTSFDAELSRGLDILGASDKGDPDITRADANPNSFLKVVAEAQRLQRLTNDVTLLLAARGQMADSALLSSEEFGAGGINYGRGYDASEIIGEDGFATKVELQWNQPLDAPIFTDYDVYSFYDFGKVWNDDATGSDDDESLASVGAGIRADFAYDIKGGFAVAVPLTRDVEVENDRDPRFYVNFSKSF